MYVFHRILLFLIPIAWIVGMEVVKKYYSSWWIVGICFFVLLLAVNFFICKKKLNKNFLHFLILPFCFSVSGFLFLIFLVNLTLYHVLVVLIALILYFLVKQYYLYFYFPLKYQPYSLESLSVYIIMAAIFFLFSSLFAARILLRFDLILLLLIMVVMLSLIVYYFYWINKISFNRSKIFIIITALIAAELFVAISYLPTSYYVNAFMITISLYLVLNLGKLFLLDLLNKRRIINHIVVATIALLAVILTARWD